MKPSRVKRHGNQTWENAEMEALRKANCMCLHCVKCGINSCSLSARFFALCCEGECAFIMTRCSQWQAASEEVTP